MTASKVAVLMAVYEDTRFLPEQLSSIQAQDHENVEVWVSRDCDEREMSTLLAEHVSIFGPDRFTVLKGPKKGFARNFLSMVLNPDIQADYFAYSDQDDVWEPDKLSRAIAELELVPQTIPALYGSRTRLIDGDGRNLGLFPFHGRTPSFANALVQNIASGHTMVMNRAARKVLISSGITDVVFHDWWTYLIITGTAGRVFYDLRPTVRYRQHDRNLTGAPPGYSSGYVRRIRRILEGDGQRANHANIRALQSSRHLLTRENSRILDAYTEVCRSSPWTRLQGLRESGVYRQTFLGDVGLLTAAALQKL